MLEKLMQEIQKGGTFTPATLAKRLNTSVEMVQMMLEQLAKMGVIGDFSTTCPQPRSACGLAEACHAGTAQKTRLWKAG
jgi:hypothetical protein